MDTNGGDQEVNYTGKIQPAVQAPVSVPSPAQPIVPDASLPEPTEALMPPQDASSSDSLIQWDASEFIDHQKGAAWLFPLAGIAIVVAGVVYFLTKNIFSSAVLLLAGLSFGVFAYKKPRTVSYSLQPYSIQIGEKTYSYDDFRTFSIMQEGGLYSIFLEPIRRFMPPLTIYFAPEDGEKIFDTLAEHIPHQEKNPDAIDRFLQRIRF